MLDIFNNIDIILPIPVKLWTRLCYGYIVAYYRLRRQVEENIRILPERKLEKFLNDINWLNEEYDDLYYWICDYFQLEKLGKFDPDKEVIEISMRDLHKISFTIEFALGSKDLKSIIRGEDICCV